MDAQLIASLMNGLNGATVQRAATLETGSTGCVLGMLGNK